ncbi:MAG: hydantoinase/oxoprolinase family protein [Deltaproteobacteria bacterium]|nr:hydantoinase/oxoprolinase family protein [Deltaproteobacteria bacterium]
MSYAIGIDMGGTFVDAVLLDKVTGELRVQKAPSTPARPFEGIMNAVRLLADQMALPVQELLAETQEIIHGTTALDNAFISRTLPRVGLITTKGFKWTLPFMRGGIPFTDDIRSAQKAGTGRETAWVPPFLIREVRERIDYRGREISPLNGPDVEEAVRELVAQKVEAIAVCLLWSFKNPAHELAIEEHVRQHHPDVFVSISSKVMPVMREFERTVTTVLNCFLTTTIEPYLRSLTDELRRNRYGRSIFLMQSSGGVMATGDRQQPFVFAWNSGPSGGVKGAEFVGGLKAQRDILSLDMGGTSTDVSLIMDGAPQMVSRPEIHGYSAVLPILDITSIGAGGGSIAWVDSGPTLRVGPRSAGANPGPASYGLGGELPTVTDADVFLGYINPSFYWGGKIALRKDLAAGAISRLAGELRMDPMEVAAGIQRVCHSNMINAMRLVTIEKGYDPRRVLMMSFGGAGPTHSAFLMDALGIGQNLIPFTETAHSAFGFLTSNIRYDYSLTEPTPVPCSPAAVGSLFERLERTGAEALARAAVPPEKRFFLRFAELRYRGQVWEVIVPVPSGTLDDEAVGRVVDAFEARYQALYGEGTAWRESGIEFVNFRVEACGRFDRPPLKTHSSGWEPDARAARKGERECFFEGSFRTTPTYDGERLVEGMIFEGPAILEKIGTTVVIPPGKIARVDEYRNVLIQREDDR